jgi:hypothetical protein
MADQDVKEIDAAPAGGGEKFIKKDHVEFWLYSGRNKYLLSFNSNGRKYDSKNLNPTWSMEWELKVRKFKTGWSAMITFPLNAFKLKPGTKTTLKWSALRENKHIGAKSETSVYKGMSLHYKRFPIIIE